MTFNFFAMIHGGEGPDVWDKEKFISAVDFRDAANQACALANEFGGIVVSLEQNDYKPVNSKTEREVELEDLLTSARAIAQRKGVKTAWNRFDDRLAKAGIGSVTAKTFRILPSDENPEDN